MKFFAVATTLALASIAMAACDEEISQPLAENCAGACAAFVTPYVAARDPPTKTRPVPNKRTFSVYGLEVGGKNPLGN
ncbi:hypothetical protein HYFRA_00008809 [Hymenoscyphus fraxineus]|uniref:Uncharacterized protein n=1 Tax=Hymenoscyphus fraxineus TaxID=746836 RepID=A0A9N9PU83_9HELO|nr:hypothetical protein HYFRA_00008809 [Hymenoscyphus fraxineus]